MRKALTIALAAAGALALSGCSGGADEPSPTVQSAETVAPAPVTTSPEEAAPDGVEPAEEAGAEGTPADTDPIQEYTTTLPPVEQPTPQGGPWTPLDGTLRSAADVVSQDALPQSFKDFLVSRIGVEDDTGCTVEEVSLRGIHPDGFVYGVEESNCGGAQTVWGIADNQWNYIVAFLDAPPCPDVAYNHIPEGAPGLRCTDEDGTARDY